MGFNRQERDTKGMLSCGLVIQVLLSCYWFILVSYHCFVDSFFFAGSQAKILSKEQHACKLQKGELGIVCAYYSA